MKLDDLGTKSYGSITENAETIRNRQAVAMGWYTTVPASFMLDLGTSMKMRMVTVSDAELAEMKKLNPGFVRHVIPKGTYSQYGIEEDVVTDPGADHPDRARQDLGRHGLQDHQGDRRGPGGLRRG